MKKFLSVLLGLVALAFIAWSTWWCPVKLVLDRFEVNHEFLIFLTMVVFLIFPIITTAVVAILIFIITSRFKKK